MTMKAKKHMFVSILVLLLLASSCSGPAETASGIRMAFLETDSGRHYDIGTYVTAGTADFISSEICAIRPADADMQDDSLPAKAFLKINITDNEMSAAKRIYEKIYPASTTKLMTALLILKYADLTETAVVQTDNGGITVPGAKLCNFTEGDRVTLDTILNCLLIYSGNDACVVAAEFISGTEAEFVKLMNREAALIGAVDTNFVNSHGLHDEQHYTTVYDMYLIFMECLQYDAFCDIIRRSEYNALYKDKNSEPLSRYYENSNLYMIGTMEAPEGVKILGGKTGSTGSAGDCLILLAEKEKEDGSKTQYITGVFQASSKNSLYSQISYLLAGE